MKRGKRDYENYSQHYNQNIRKRARYPSSHFHQDDKSCQHLIASKSSIEVNEATSASTPKLSELRLQRQNRSDWLWDKAPPGLESYSARTLKLFGVVSPNGDLSLQQLPAELLNLRKAKPLTPENSWIYRKVHNTIYPDLQKASLVETGRPSNLPSFPSALTSRDSIITKNISNPSSLLERYGSGSVYNKLDATTFAVLPENKAAPEGSDKYLLLTKETTPIIEVLNSVPLKDKELDVAPILESMCRDLGTPAKRIWTKSFSAECPYNLTRVFIQIEDPEKVEFAAERLGQRSIQGRELATTINYSPELQ